MPVAAFATYPLQANYSSESWFNKNDVKNVVAHQPRDNDCEQLIKNLQQAHENDPRFRYEVLLYAEYKAIPGALQYEHDDDDMVAVMWPEPKQVALGLSHT